MSPQEIAAKKRSEKMSDTREHAAPHSVDTIAIMGLGYVGLPLAILSAERGYSVIGFDIDEVKITQLEKREANFLSDHESQSFREAHRLRITSTEESLSSANIFIICVPTPVHDDHIPDLSPLQSASEIVGRHLKRGDLVIVESTVNPGVCENVVLPLLESSSGLDRLEFDFAHCPERINPGDTNWNSRSIPRVLGSTTATGLQRAQTLYESLLDAKVLPMKNLKEAEAVKMVENSFRDINIAFVNELAMAFDKAGIDIVNVIRGAATKPFAFMPHFPGCGVGGHCIPVDPYYLIRYGAENGFEHRFLSTARRINERMPGYTVHLLIEALAEYRKTLKGSRIALLGLAYKRDVPDMRESPALVIQSLLQENGAQVAVYDPYAPRAVSTRNLQEALSAADAAIIATDHAIIRALTPEQLIASGVRIVVDGRNCLDKERFIEAGIAYRGIGRNDV